MFCSIICRNTANGKKVGGWNKNRVTLHCEWCDKAYEVPLCRTTNKGSSHTASRCCSRKCLGALQSSERKGKFQMGANNPTYTTGISTYRRYKKSKCERCGSAKYLLVHHKDEDRTNNKISNLETLCQSCHHVAHEKIKNITDHKRRLKPLKSKKCSYCGRKFIPTINSTKTQNQQFCSRKCSAQQRWQT